MTITKRNGFTLVELMIVVAIIGILSAIAVPNFKKYQAKSKTTEAKLQLAAAYTAEQAFFGEYNIYARCLSYMGYDPSSEASQRYYMVGFNLGTVVDATAYSSALSLGINSAAYAAGGCAPSGSGSFGDTVFEAHLGVGGSVCSVGNACLGVANTAPHQFDIGTQADVNSMTFHIGAGGRIDSDFVSTSASGNHSLISIDQNKKISILRNGY